MYPLLDLMGIFDGDAVKPNWLLLEISTLYILRKYLNKWKSCAVPLKENHYV